jgi:hypothetical protein
LNSQFAGFLEEPGGGEFFQEPANDGVIESAEAMVKKSGDFTQSQAAIKAFPEEIFLSGEQYIAVPMRVAQNEES